MKVGDHPSLQPITARSFLPVSSGLFVLPKAGLPPSRLLAASRQVAQASAIERVRQKAELHDLLLAAREGISAVAGGDVGDDAIARAANGFDSFLDALDGGGSGDRRRAGELRASIDELRSTLAPSGIDVVAGKLAPAEAALAMKRDVAPEAISDAFLAVRDRLDPVFAAHSEALAVEAETARARIPVTQTAASLGATLAGITLRGASLTKVIGKLNLAGRRQLSQAQKIQRLAAISLPKPRVPGTVLPGFPALGKPVGVSGPEYELARRTPGIAPGKAVVSESKQGRPPAFEPPGPVELARPGAGPPGQRAEITAAVREVDRKLEGRPASGKIEIPRPGVRRRVDAEGVVHPAKPSLRPAKRPQKPPPAPEPAEDQRRKGVPELAPPTQESRPVTRPDVIPRNPGKPLKDLLPAKPLPNVPGEAGGKGKEA